MISVAPMIGWTDKNYRYLIRQITKQCVLYTEMVMDNALLHNPLKLDDFIDYDPVVEPPLVLQLGGNDPEKLGQAVELCENYKGPHFTEINLNCGCPSNKAKKAGFGAELMLEPELVRQIVYEMKRKSTEADITVKCRIGTNQRNSWEELVEFVEACKQGGVRKMIVHSRICILCGLSPAQNRSVPPLRYDVTHSLVRAFPEMTFVLNGGLRTFEEVDSHLGLLDPSESFTNEGIPPPEVPHCNCSAKNESELGQQFPPPPHHSLNSGSFIENDHFPPPSPFSFPLPPSDSSSQSLLWSVTPPVHGVMIGREAYHNPWLLADVDRRYYHTANPGLSRRDVLERYLEYCDRAQDRGEFKALTPILCRPLHNYFHNHSRNGLYKRRFDELIKEYTSTRRHCRDVRVGEIVWRAMEGVIDEEYLEERMTSDGVMRAEDSGR
jgi:tRNA dihydrouridine synthase A